MMETLPVSFTLAQFREVTPIDESNIWALLLERNSGRISVKRRDTALENLENIVVATFRLANTVGFQAMTLRDLCRESGFSMGGLYGYIENKDQLAAMIEDMVNHVTEMLPTWFKHVTSEIDQIESILRAYICLSEIFQPWLYFVFLESRTLQPAQRDIAKASELHMQSHLARLIGADAGLSAERGLSAGGALHVAGSGLASEALEIRRRQCHRRCLRRQRSPARSASARRKGRIGMNHFP